MGKKWKRLLIQARQNRAAAAEPAEAKVVVEKTVAVEEAPAVAPPKAETPEPPKIAPTRTIKRSKTTKKVSKKD